MKTSNLLIGAALAAGCGNVTMSAADAPPGATDGPGAADARPPDGPTSCDPTHAFGTPVPLQGLVVAGRTLSAPRLSADELTAYVTDYTGSTWDLYVAQRSTPDGAFETPTPMTAENSSAYDYDPAASADGLTLWFASNRSGQNHIYVAGRSSTLTDFGAPGLATGVNSQSDEDVQPFESPDGQELWFTSTRAPNLGLRDLWVATRSGSGFGNPVHADALSSAAEDWGPAITGDGLTIFFQSNRGGAGSKGGFDIYTSHRAHVTDAFPAPTPVDELNTSGDDAVGWISPDDCRLYFSTPGGSFVATRLP